MECYEKQTGTYTLKQQLFFNQRKINFILQPKERPTEETGGLEVKKNVHCEEFRIQREQKVTFWSHISKFHNSLCKNFCRMTIQQLHVKVARNLNRKAYEKLIPKEK